MNDNAIVKLDAARVYLERTQASVETVTREVMALLIKAWNAYITGQSLKQLKWSQDEKFPVLIFNPA